MVFDPSTVPDSQKVKLTCDSSGISSDQTDFPLTVVLDATDPLCAAVFAALGTNNKKLSIEGNSPAISSVTAKSVIFDIADNWGRNVMGIRSIEFFLGGSLVPITLSDIVGYVSSEYSSSYVAEYSFVTSLSKTQVHTGNQWLSAINQATNQRLICVFNTPIEFDEIVINNGYNGGASPDLGVNMGAKSTVITISSDSISNTTYGATITNPTVLFNGQLTQHPATISADDQTYYTTTPVPGGIVQLPVEIESWDTGKAVLHTKVPTYSASTDPELVLSYDPTQPDNTDYVGDTGDVIAQSVWNANFVAVYHMAQDPSGTAPQILDSTSNGYDCTSAGTMLTADLIDGLTGKAIDFDGTDDKITSGASDFSALETSATLELLAKWNTVAIGEIALSIGGATGTLQIGIGSAVGVLGNGVSGDFVDTAIAPATASYQHIANTLSAGTLTLYGDGVADATTNAVTVASLSSTSIIAGARYDGSYSDIIIDEIRISNIARSADWIKLTNLSLTDQLITISAYTVATSIQSLLSMPYYLEGSLQKLCDMPYGLTSKVGPTLLEIVYSLRLQSLLAMPYGDTPRYLNTLIMYYGPAKVLRSMLEMKYGNAKPIKNLLKMEWNYPQALISLLEMRYHISGGQIMALADMVYDIQEREMIKALLTQYYAIMPDGTLLIKPTISFVTETGLDLDPYHINIEIDEDEFAIKGELWVAEDKYKQCRAMETVVSGTIDTTTYTLLVETADRDLTGPADKKYILTLASPTIKLDAPYAATITLTFDAGNGSDIVTDLAAEYDIEVDWQMIDEYIPSGILYANDETPLTVIRKIVSAWGGILQSSPAGKLICRAEYPDSTADYETLTPTYTLTDQNDYFTVKSTSEINDNFNVFLISNQDTGTEGLTIESEDIDAETKEIHVYQVPYNEDDVITLKTSGGSWVGIVDEGIVTEQLTETVEIVGGEGQTEKPLYSLDDTDYKQSVLGSVTPSEDGTLTTETSGNSLVEVTYTTIYRKYTVTDPDVETVQFWPEVADE